MLNIIKSVKANKFIILINSSGNMKMIVVFFYFIIIIERGRQCKAEREPSTHQSEDPSPTILTYRQKE